VLSNKKRKQYVSNATHDNIASNILYATHDVIEFEKVKHPSVRLQSLQLEELGQFWTCGGGSRLIESIDWFDGFAI
jgi:hypothetical protein